MSSSLQISDLLKVAKDIPILHTGINETAMEYSTYPVKEHPKLLSSTGKPASTRLIGGIDLQDTVFLDNAK